MNAGLLISSATAFYPSSVSVSASDINNVGAGQETTFSSFCFYFRFNKAGVSSSTNIATSTGSSILRLVIREKSLY